MICDWLTDKLTDAFNWKYPLDGSRMLNSSHNRRSKNSPLPLTPSIVDCRESADIHVSPPPCSKNYSSVILRSPAPWRHLRARRHIVSCLRERIYPVGSLLYIAKQHSNWPWSVLENSTVAPSTGPSLVYRVPSPRGDFSPLYFIHIAR